MRGSTAQELCRHPIGGCALRTGDKLGSGTISGADQDGYGSLLEVTRNCRAPMTLEGGIARTFIEGGDTVTLRGWAQGEDHRIGLGECRGTILSAHPARE